MHRSTLPAHYKEREHILDAFLGERFGEEQRKLPDSVISVFDPRTCPSDFLDVLGKKMSLVFWNNGLKEEEKRRYVAEAFAFKKKKGTVSAVNMLFSILGIEGSIEEAKDVRRHDASLHYDASEVHGGLHWWTYRISLATPITRARGALLESLLLEIAPARSHLLGMDFIALQSRDGTIRYDGTNTHGKIGENYGNN